jgi:hypothetical protein
MQKIPWGIVAVVTFFISIVSAETGIGVLIAIFELVFFVSSLKAITEIEVKGSILKAIGVLGLVAFLGFMGLALLFGGVLTPPPPNIKSNFVFGESMVWLGILTILLSMFTYAWFKMKGEERAKERDIEKTAYLKRKGELEAEKEAKSK